MRRLDVRFTSPAYPGEPLHVDVWKVGLGDAAFRVVATDHKVVVEDFGALRISILSEVSDECAI